MCNLIFGITLSCISAISISCLTNFYKRKSRFYFCTEYHFYLVIQTMVMSNFSLSASWHCTALRICSTNIWSVLQMFPLCECTLLWAIISLEMGPLISYCRIRAFGEMHLSWLNDQYPIVLSPSLILKDKHTHMTKRVKTEIGHLRLTHRVCPCPWTKDNIPDSSKHKTDNDKKI